MTKMEQLDSKAFLYYLVALSLRKISQIYQSSLMLLQHIVLKFFVSKKDLLQNFKMNKNEHA